MEPVTTKNGQIYERRLIEKYISTTGQDPVTKEPLSASDLIELKGTCGNEEQNRSFLIFSF